MEKTGAEIENDIFNLINHSAISSSINGSVYREGTRPLNSKKEDALVMFLKGNPGQIQEGFLNINIYVPDIDAGLGFPVKNITRLTQLQRIAQNVVDSLNPNADYKFRLDSTITTFKLEEDGVKQHFVNVRLFYEYVTF
ncbi:MAG: hypothetical protein A2X18_07715 [Bacteroidetes bacterium GWF2_40_14]|nr:MAG: hypothetical protein A2X18_07715 [Bacteroidetes bacterium GWF2_40_14]